MADTSTDNLQNVPVSIGLIEIKGLKKTKSDLIQPLFSQCLSATTFGSLSSCLRESVDKMQRLDIFKNINVLMDKMPEDQAGHDVVVVIEAEEKKFRLHAGTEVQKNDIAFNVSGQLYNLFGRGEKLDASASVGQHTKAPLNLAFTKPLSGNPDKLFKFSLGSFSSTYPAGVKYCHSSHHAEAAFKVPGGLADCAHEFKFGLDWRTLFNLSPLSSPTIRRSAGHSLKSALSHTFLLDNRDDSVFPTSGNFLRISHEFAGGPLGGDANHLKQDLFGSVHFALPKLPDVVLSCSLHAGHLMSLGSSKSFLLDRFKIGGPNSVRGFPLNSIGPKDQEDSLGGDLAFEGGVSLAFPIIPSLKHILRGQLFANYGILGLSNSGALSVRDRITLLKRESQPHISAGGGLMIKMGPTTRLELNVAVPLTQQDTSKPSSFLSGIQIGLGVEFL